MVLFLPLANGNQTSLKLVLTVSLLSVSDDDLSQQLSEGVDASFVTWDHQDFSREAIRLNLRSDRFAHWHSYVV